MKATRRLGGIILGMVLVFGVAWRDVSAEKPEHRGGSVELLVPAYFDATDPAWARLADAARRVPLTVILNPDSGPGDPPDPDFLADVVAIRKAGGRVLGYVHTSYGNRAFGDVSDDIIKYWKFYPIDGIFIDEMTNDDNASDYAYYGEIYRFIKHFNPGLRVVGNPGAPTTEGYLTHGTADMLILFEDPIANYSAFSPPAWTMRYPASRFGNIVYNAPPHSVAAVLRRAARLRAGLVYVTDDGVTKANFGNVYERLPVYWDHEVALVARMSER